MTARTPANIAQTALVGLGSASFTGGLALMVATTGVAGGNPLAWLLAGNAVASLGAALVIFAEPCARFLQAIKR